MVPLPPSTVTSASSAVTSSTVSSRPTFSTTMSAPSPSTTPMRPARPSRRSWDLTTGPRPTLAGPDSSRLSGLVPVCATGLSPPRVPRVRAQECSSTVTQTALEFLLPSLKNRACLSYIERVISFFLSFLEFFFSLFRQLSFFFRITWCSRRIDMDHGMTLPVVVMS